MTPERHKELTERHGLLWDADKVRVYECSACGLRWSRGPGSILIADAESVERRCGICETDGYLVASEPPDNRDRVTGLLHERSPEELLTRNGWIVSYDTEQASVRMVFETDGHLGYLEHAVTPGPGDHATRATHMMTLARRAWSTPLPAGAWTTIPGTKIRYKATSHWTPPVGLDR